MSKNEKIDTVIIGGGIVGLATAWRLLERFPDRRVVVLEKEKKVAHHQTGNNSGVIHSGIYYKPGSFKATLCRRGYAQMLEFAKAHQIPHEICGKLVVATSKDELPRLEALREKAIANGVKNVTQVSAHEIRQFEPHGYGIQALHVPETGIINYTAVCEVLAREIKSKGGEVRTLRRVNALYETQSNGVHCKGIRYESGVTGNPKLSVSNTNTNTNTDTDTDGTGDDEGSHELIADFVINCGGLHSDRIARLDGLEPGVSIVPFRGEYYELTHEAQSLVKNLIYPVPDPAFPFLGVHFTRMVMGGVECGPNAVLAMKREGYKKTDFSAKDLAEVLLNPGFRKLAAKHWRMGLGEFQRSFSKAAFTKALQRLLPDIRASHLKPAGAGVRAQALRRDGSLVDDFFFVEGKRSLHVLNAPSPAATASLAIGEEIVERYAKALG